MKSSLSSAKMRATIRSLLQKHQLTYREFSKQLGVSEASMKKLMTRGELTFEKVEAIAGQFGLSLAEFIQLSYESKSSPIKLTAQQEQSLVEFPISIVAMFLLGKGFSLATVKQRIGTDEPAFQKALCILDRIGAIELHSEKRALVKLRGPFSFIKGGPIEKNFRARYLELVARQISSCPPAGTVQKTFELYLSEETFENMRIDLEQLIGKYGHIARLEAERGHESKIFPVTGLFMVKPFDGWGTLLRNL